MNSNIKKALSEGRLKFFNNGKYKYTPSKEYVTRFGNNNKSDSEIKVLRDSIKKLDRIDYAFTVAENRNKKVSHVSNGKIILV